MDFISAWWHGENVRNVVLWGLPVFAWGRIGLLLSVAGPAVIIAELSGVEKLRTWGESLGKKQDLKRALLHLLLAVLWLFTLPLVLLFAARDGAAWLYRRWTARFGPIPVVESVLEALRERRNRMGIRTQAWLEATFGDRRKSVASSSTVAFLAIALLIALPLALGVTWSGWHQLAAMGVSVAAFSHLLSLITLFLWVLLLGFLFPGSVVAGSVLFLVPLVGMLWHLCCLRPLIWLLSHDNLNRIKAASVFAFVAGLFFTLLSS